jgi:ATP-dependent Lon protease
MHRSQINAECPIQAPLPRERLRPSAALLRKSADERISPFPRRIYPTAFVTGMPQAEDADEEGGVEGLEAVSSAVAEPVPSSPKRTELAEGHHVFAENRKGVSFETLFGPYLDGATRIVVTDPYVRLFYQIRNMMEFVEMFIRRKAPEDQVSIHLVTGPHEGEIGRQRDLLDSIDEASTGTGVTFTWGFDASSTAHARDITSDTGWKIVLDRGLDIFQSPVKKEGFSLGDRLQEHRMLKSFYVTYVKMDQKTDAGDFD